MAKIASSFLDISYLDSLSRLQSPIHRLDPRVKVIATALYLISVVSFGKYEITGLIPFFVYPIVLIALGDLPLVYLLKKILIAAPFAFFIGMFNPLIDRAVVMHLGPIGISGGWISFVSIMLRFVLTVGAVLALIASTGFASICMSLEKMGVPNVFAVQLLFLYRYIFVLIDEASRMVRARSLRVFEKRGMGFSVFISMIGQLLLRALDRAQRIHRAMRCRGFDGEIRMTRPLAFCRRDGVFVLGWSALFVLMRLYDIPQWMGERITGLIG
jgi:cobalt/nickel transport system permease protein